MNLFRVRHPSLGTQYFLADAPSAEEWDDTTHFLPLHHRGAAGRQVRLGSPQHAYKDGLARAQLRDHVPETLTRAQISVERISLDALDEIHVSERDEPVKSRALLHMGTVSSRVGARTGFWVSAATPGRCEVCVLDGGGDGVAFHTAPTVEEARGLCLSTLWHNGVDPMAPGEYDITELWNLRAFAHALRVAEGSLHFAEVTTRVLYPGAQEPMEHAAIWISSEQGSHFSAALTQGTRVIRHEGDTGSRTAALCAMSDALFPGGTRHGNPEFKRVGPYVAILRLLKIASTSTHNPAEPLLDFGEVRMPNTRVATYVMAESNGKARCVVFLPGGDAGVAFAETRDQALRAALTDAGWVGVPNTLLDPRSLTASDFSGVLRGRAGLAAPTGIYFGHAARPHGGAANYVWTETPGGTLCTVFSRTADGSDIVAHGRGGDLSAALDEALWMAGWPAESIKARTGGRTSVEEFLAGLRQGSPGVSTRAETRAEEPTSDTDAARALRERLLDALTSYQEEQSQVHRTLRVLLGYDTPEEHDGRTLYGGRTQFALTGAARELRIAYLRGRYDLLGPLTGNLLAYAAAPAEVYISEGEDP